MEFTLVTGDPDKDFLSQNPELKFFPFVNAIQLKYKEEKVSQILWSLYLVEDPKSKIYYGIKYEDRINVVENKYGIDYAKECTEWIDSYTNAAMGPHERNYKRLQDKYQKMIQSVENSELKESVEFFKNISLFTKGMDQIEEKYTKELEQAKVKYRGDKKPGGLYRQR